MKYFNKKPRYTHGNALNEGPTVTNMPEEDKIKASKKMHKTVGKYFAPYSPEEVEAINQFLHNEKYYTKN